MTRVIYPTDTRKPDGRAEMGERLDCSVRAFTTVSGKPYPEVHSLFEKHGRRYRCSTRWKTTLAVAKELKLRHVKVSPARTVRLFLQDHADTPCVAVRHSGHMFAIKRGQLADHQGTRANARITDYFEPPDEPESNEETGMLTVINNTTMEPVATVEDMGLAVAWAETVPYANDFSIIGHRAECLSAYNPIELYQLHGYLTNSTPIKEGLTRQELIPRVLDKLDTHIITSNPPQDAKRVAPIKSPNHEENEMAKKKATSKKTTVKKTAVKKTATKKAPAEKVEREKRNGVLTPKEGTVTAAIFAICDDLSKKAGAPVPGPDAIDACVKAGIKLGSAKSGYQYWRKYHGLTNKAA